MASTGVNVALGTHAEPVTVTTRTFEELMLAVMITAGASAAYAQIVATFDASFAFRLGTTVHQPGKYRGAHER